MYAYFLPTGMFQLCRNAITMLAFDTIIGVNSHDSKLSIMKVALFNDTLVVPLIHI